MTTNAAPVHASAARPGGPRRVDVVVVGAGFGGLYAIWKFREMGLKVQGFEAGGDVGGVWYWNRYPGARVDLPSIDYSYSFSREIEQEWTWSEEFAAQPELLSYFNFVATRLDLRKHIQFNTRVSGATWDDTRKLWEVRTGNGDVVEAPYCVMATGPLSIPKDPDIPGIQRFRGELLRAQKWPQQPVSFAGKRVGVIGTGSSGIQIVQELGPKAGELYVFQRTPSFTMPMRNQKLAPDFMAEVKRNYAGIREIARNSPNGGVRPWSTRGYFTVTPERRREILEDAWKQGGLAMLGAFTDLMTNEEANNGVADFVRSKIDAVVKDPATAEKLKPRDYPIFARRPCIDTNYYESYNRPNVHLKDCVTDPIVEITEQGVRTQSGEVELDMIIFATGYDALTGAMLSFEVRGRNGRTLNDKWKDGPRSAFGMMLEGFPNLFMTTGPNGPAALANIVRISEHDVDWAAAAIIHMRRNGFAAIEPTAAGEEEWMDVVRSLAQRSLMTKAKTWWVGANVQGKPQGLTMFTGGFQKYREYCAAAANGYRNFAFDRAKEALAA